MNKKISTLILSIGLTFSISAVTKANTLTSTSLTNYNLESVSMSDYCKAVDALTTAWNSLGSDSINSAIENAENAINKVNDTYSKGFLKEQLEQIKDKSTPLVMPSDNELLQLINNANEAIDTVVFSNWYEANSLTTDGYYQILGSMLDSREKVRSYLSNYFSEKIILDFETIVRADYREDKYTIAPYQGESFNYKFIKFNKKQIVNNKLYLYVSASTYQGDSKEILYVLEKQHGKFIFTFFNSYTGEMGVKDEDTNGPSSVN